MLASFWIYIQEGNCLVLGNVYPKRSKHMCLSKDVSRNEYSNLIHNRMKQGKNKQTKNQVFITATATAKSLQSCPPLCDPIDGSPPGSVVPGILQARTLEWVAISFSSA